MPSALFRYGSPTYIQDYTPDADATAGDVIVENDVPCIMHRDYDNAGVTGSPDPQSIAAGGGVYLCTAPTGYTADYQEAAYWNASTGITKTQSDYHFGRFLATKATGDTTVLVLHDPVVGLLDES